MRGTKIEYESRIASAKRKKQTKKLSTKIRTRKSRRKKDKQRASNPEAFKAHHNQEKQQSRDNQKDNTDVKVRRNNFCRAVIFGPIFICSCCRRRLYENGVTKITSK